MLLSFDFGGGRVRSPLEIREKSEYTPATTPADNAVVFACVCICAVTYSYLLVRASCVTYTYIYIYIYVSPLIGAYGTSLRLADVCGVMRSPDEAHFVGGTGTCD